MTPTRIDHLEDPDAPAATSVVPSANMIATDDNGRLLFIRRSDNGNYALPGGAMDLGESLTDTAVRETFEETGYQVEVDNLVGVFSNPGHVLHYTSNDEVRQEMTVVYSGRVVAGAPVENDEASEIVWVARSDVRQLSPMHPSMAFRVALYLDGAEPHIDRPGDVAAFLDSTDH